MSSRILPDARAAVTRPVAWRQVGENGALQPEGVEPAPDPARIAELIRAEYEPKLREAHAAGLREGESRARAAAQAEVEAAVQRASASVQEISNLRNRLRREAEADLIRLAMAIARRILHRELAIDPEAMSGLILAALQRIQAQEVSRVRIHPDHLALLRNSVQKLGGAAGLEISGDPGLARGSLIFETSRGNLDVSVESQLQEIERGLADRLRRHG